MAAGDAGGRSSVSRWRRRGVKLGVGALALAPALVTVVRFFTGRLGANPIAEAMNLLGYWGLVLLLATLACTPLKVLLGWNWPLLVRRLLGLCAFFTLSLHFGTYLVLDQFFDWSAIWQDIAKRKFITVGFAGFVLLIALAVTSTNRMVKRLGFPRWKRLHRLGYVATALGIVHFVWRVKADLVEPLIMGGVLMVLLALRLLPGSRARP